MIRRILVAVALAVTLVPALVVPVAASAVAPGKATVNMIPKKAGIKITRVSYPDPSHSSLTVWGYAATGGRSVSLSIERSISRNKWAREAETGNLVRRETFKLVSKPFACNSAFKVAQVNSLPKGGDFDSTVWQSGGIRRLCPS